MLFTATTATRKIMKMNKRIRLVAGGTSASKTISILLYLISRAQSDTTPTLTSIVSESFPHLKRGAMRDFINILQAHNYFNDDRWNKSESTYTFETGSKIEFFSADMASKVRGPRRDRLFVNEANNIERESWEQLLLRTRELAFADWNPVVDFYMYEDYGLQDDKEPSSSDEDVEFIILTYKDNESLEAAIVKEIEKREINKQWFNVYGRGRRGEVSGKIFKGWNIIDDIPNEASLVRRGMDFGYSNDPTVIVNIFYYMGGYIIDEVVYRTGMKNRDIIDRINAEPQPETLVIADTNELKSIDDIAEAGVNIIGVLKRPGYVRRGTENSLIDWVQTQRVSITKRSTNLIKSYRNFMWQTDKDGKILNEYDHFWSDGMMATIYGLSNFQPKKEEQIEYSTGAFATSWI